MAYFVGPVFAVGQSVMKTMKIGPLDNFPLYCNNKEAIHSSQNFRFEVFNMVHTVATYIHITYQFESM